MKPYRQNWGKRLFSLVLIVGMAGMIGLFVWWCCQKEPLDTAQAFLDAIQRRDWIMVARFVHPEERKQLGLTPEWIKTIGEWLVAPIGQRLGKIEGLAAVENPFLPTPEEQRVYFRGARFFRLRRSDGQEGALLVVIKTGDGWRVNFSMFVYTLVTEAIEKGQLPNPWRTAVLQKVGIHRIFVGSESIPIPP